MHKTAEKGHVPDRIHNHAPDEHVLALQDVYQSLEAVDDSDHSKGDERERRVSSCNDDEEMEDLRSEVSEGSNTDGE